MTRQAYLDPTPEQGRDLFLSGISGAVTMLNLSRILPLTQAAGSVWR